NGGSALAADSTAVLAIFNTHLAASTAALVWMIIEYYKTEKFSTLGLATGALAGLVSITPAAGFVQPWAALIIGAISAVVCFGILTWRSKSKIDESLDAWAVHGWGGIWGAIATGIFASVGFTGLIKGNLGQVWIQIVGVIATILYSFLVTWVIAKVINKLMNLRTSEEVEYLGIDIAIHGEKV
ncbi:MAG: ammonium transporter, partial [Promethearchaeota archaeon]